VSERVLPSLNKVDPPPAAQHDQPPAAQQDQPFAPEQVQSFPAQPDHAPEARVDPAPAAQPDAAPAAQLDAAPGPATTRDDPAPNSAPSNLQDALRAEVQRLTAENERYRQHAERTSKLFLAATSYADWVRENARRDAELALRKARARVVRLERITSDLHEKERERARLQSELERVQSVIDETRAQLSAFLTAGLEALHTDGPLEGEAAREPAFDDLRDALHSQLGPSSASALGPSASTQDPSDLR
jgi:DNA repair exonuclease SbcCD ATPase subunit